jgi:hypothetical protein
MWMNFSLGSEGYTILNYLNSISFWSKETICWRVKFHATMFVVQIRLFLSYSLCSEKKIWKNKSIITIFLSRTNVLITRKDLDKKNFNLLNKMAFIFYHTYNPTLQVLSCLLHKHFLMLEHQSLMLPQKKVLIYLELCFIKIYLLYPNEENSCHWFLSLEHISLYVALL